MEQSERLENVGDSEREARESERVESVGESERGRERVGVESVGE